MLITDFITGVVFFFIVGLILLAPDLNEDEHNYW